MTAIHQGHPLLAAGAPLTSGGAAVIMVHGRGAGPENILDLVPRLNHPSFSYLAPAAANRTWYPLSFLAPIAQNEPHLTSALARLDEVVAGALAAGIARERIVLLGFSQGACLASEYVARHPARYGGLIAFSGGLIGPPGTTWPIAASLDGTPVFLGCSDVDAHVPKTRVDESASIFSAMGASVIERIYPGMGHLVVDEEIAEARRILDGLLGN